MAENLKKRKRKVDLTKMTDEQAELIGEQIGKKIGEIGDAAAAKINEITKIYGLKAKIAVQLINEKTGQVL